MKSVLVLLMGLVMGSSVAHADLKYAIEAGIRQQSGDAEAGASTNSEMGLQFGATAVVPLSGAWNLRTGMLYTQRNLTISGSPDNKVEMSYLDIPVTAMYKFEDYAGVFLGVNLAMSLDKKASQGSVEGANSMLLPIVVGASFKVLPDFGLSIYYENASGKIADGLKDYRAVGANLLITFE